VCTEAPASVTPHREAGASRHTTRQWRRHEVLAPRACPRPDRGERSGTLGTNHFIFIISSFPLAGGPFIFLPSRLREGPGEGVVLRPNFSGTDTPSPNPSRKREGNNFNPFLTSTNARCQIREPSAFDLKPAVTTISLLTERNSALLLYRGSDTAILRERVLQDFGEHGCGAAFDLAAFEHPD